MIRTEAIDKPLYNSRIIDTFLKLIKMKYSFINVGELLSHAGMESYQVEDEGHWFSQRQVNLFYYRLRDLTGNDDIAREAGLFSVSPEAIGGLKKYFLGFVSPASAYSLMGALTNKFIKSSHYKTKKISKNAIEITVTPYEMVKEEYFQCENRFGYIEAITKLFNYKAPKVEHPECLFKGGKICRYIISWRHSPAVALRRIRNLLIFFLLFLNLFLLTIFSENALIFSIPASIALILLLNWHASILEAKELSSAVEHLEKSSEELIDQININYENALLVNEIGQAVNNKTDIDGVATAVAHSLQKRLDYDRGLILLSNQDKTLLLARAGFGYEELDLNKFTLNKGFRLNRKESKGVFVVCYREQKPILVNDIDELKDTLTTRSWEFVEKTGSKSFICCPIVHEGESLGVIAVDNLISKRPLIQSDINLLMGIGNQIGISISNTKLIEAKLKQFQSILQVLVASTEARDPLTAGHSEKVTEYAVGICQEQGLPNDYTDMIRVAAALHDYGKIGVDDVILKKNGRLDDDEYEQIKTHVLKTKNILSQVNFEGIYREVPEIAAAHHEKVDGTGYPNQLSGDEIHFGAKIIAVADVFEALTSRRHYRDPMPINEAFDHLVANIGVHFEKKCVESFIQYYNTYKTPIPYLYKGSFESLDNINSKAGSDKSNIYPINYIKSGEL